MKSKAKKKLILSLIKDDLINSKLVNGLNSFGLLAENYYLHLSETIFELMDFKLTIAQKEKLFGRYMRLTEKAKDIEISTSKKRLNKLTLDIYEELCVRGKK